MKKTFRVALVLLLLCFLFRGKLYRLMTSYEAVSHRETPVIPSTDLQGVADSLYLLSADAEDFVFEVQAYVAGRLSFAVRNSGSSAPDIHAGGQGNCVGYARLTADLLNRAEAFTAAGYRVRPAVAKISLLGFDLHRLFDSPFFRDHDIVEVLDGDGKAVLLVDPSLYDYTRIRQVD